MKIKHLLITVSLSLCVSASFSQEIRDTIRPKQERFREGKGQGKNPQHAQGLKAELLDSLNLSREQKKQMADITREYRDKLKNIQEDSSASRKDKFSKIREESQQYKDRARTILDSVQYQRFSEALRARLEDRLKEQRGQRKNN